MFEALTADADGEPAGYALYFRTCSTWEGRPGLFVEDLYVTPDARTYGIGRRMLGAIARRAVGRGYRRVELAGWN